MSANAETLPHTLSEASRSGLALRVNRRSLGVPREVFAPMAHFSVRKLATYEKAEELPAQVMRSVKQALRLLVALKEIIGDEGKLRDWLETDNSAFDGRTPMRVICDGESD